MTVHLSSIRTFLAALILATTTVAIGPAPSYAAKSDCPSNRFCVWTEADYSGQMQSFSATNSYLNITISTVRSYYNRRSYRSWLHEESNGSGSYSCIGPGSAASSVSTAWKRAAEAVYLATVTAC